MDPLTVITFINMLTEAGVEAATAWTAVSSMVKENRAPTAAEWALADKDADDESAAVQAAKPA